MRRGRVSPGAAALALTLSVAGCGGPERAAEEGIRIVSARVAAPVGDAPAAMYLTLLNDAHEPDTLVEIRADAADRAELHEQMSHGGRVHMEPVGMLEVPEDGEVRLSPGGRHVMLFGVRDGLSPGDTVAVELTFRRAGRVSARAPVVSYADPGLDPADAHGGH